MICKKCGKEIMDNSKYCSFCGTQIQPFHEKNDVYQSGMIQGVQKKSPKNNKKRVISLVTAIIIFAMVVIVLIISSFILTSDTYISEITFSESDTESYVYKKYEYNNENQIANIIYYNEDGTIDYIEEYDSHGNVIKETFISDGQYADYCYEYNYTYDNDGYVKSCVQTEYTYSYLDDGSEFELEEENTVFLEYDYEFNNEGNVVQKKITYNKYDHDYAWRYVYEYNGDNIETEYQYYYDIGNEKEENLYHIFGYEYNNRGQITKCIEYIQKGMIDSWSHWYEYKYAKSNKLYSIGELSGCIIGYTSNIENNSKNIIEKTGQSAADASDIETITFGTYEQDNDISNGQEPIEWIILDKNGDQLLLISRYILDGHCYHDDFKDETITWAQSSLRTWLNDEFFNTAFSSVERDKIAKKTLPDEDVSDSVFLLNMEEKSRYFPLDSDSIARLTHYAYAQPGMAAEYNGQTYEYRDGSIINWNIPESDYKKEMVYDYWMRSVTPSGVGNQPNYIDYSGCVTHGYTNSTVLGVRPVIWVSRSN